MSYHFNKATIFILKLQKEIYHHIVHTLDTDRSLSFKMSNLYSSVYPVQMITRVPSADKMQQLVPGGKYK